MKNATLALTAAVALVLSGTTMARESRSFTTDLNPLNNSGVEGTVRIVADYDAGLITVMIHASGLEPDMLHPQHIHGFMENNSNATCPTMSADQDGDHLIDLAEGLPFYGPVLLPLEPFPMAEDGTIDFVETYQLTDVLKPLQNNAIVLHGLTIDGEYIATLPVACGALRPEAGGPPMGRGRGRN